MEVKAKLGKLPQVKAQLNLWQSCTEKGRSHLSAISNAMNQLEAVKKGKLGVLAEKPHLHQLLQVKIVNSMESSLQRLLEQRKAMVGIVHKLRNLFKEERNLFEKMVSNKGLEACCSRTAEDFSLGEHCQWLQQLYASYKTDLEEKSRVLDELKYTRESLQGASEVWNDGPKDVEDILTFIDYTVGTT